MFCFQGLWLIFAVLIKIHLSESKFRCTILPGVQNLAKQPSSVKAFLNCSFDRIIVGAVNWTRNGQPVEEGNILADPHVNTTWSAVALPGMTVNQDVGEFTCAAKSGQEVSSCSTSPSKPKLLKLKPFKIVENGRTPEISCRASGWPTPRVSWWRNGSQIRNGDYYNSYILNHSADNIVSMTIIGIEGYHHGTYTCRADNSFGTSVTDITLMVKRNDMIENKYDKQFPNIALEGNNITLECICRKKECKENTANVYWKSKGHYVNQSARLVLTKTALANSEMILMTILNASKVDEVRYFCGINTSLGFEERPRKLRVLKKDMFQIGSPSQDVSANLHSHFTLRCYAIYPSVLRIPETFWRVNNTSIPKDSQHYQQKEFRPRKEPNSKTSLLYELHISNISVKDVGWYFCGVKFREVSYVVTTNISLSLKMEKTEAMAIRCYDCVPGSDDNWCELVSNVTDCDKTLGAPPGEKFDACAKGSYEIEYGGENKTMKYMSCAVKSLCNTVKKWACNNTLWEKLGITVTKCDLKCCSEDKCNSPDVYLGDTGTSKAASFIPEFLGVATIFVPFFVH